MRFLSKKQWLTLMERSDLAEYLNSKLTKFKDDETIPAFAMRSKIEALDADEYFDDDSIFYSDCTLYELADTVKDFEKEQEFLIKLTYLFD